VTPEIVDDITLPNFLTDIETWEVIIDNSNEESAETG